MTSQMCRGKKRKEQHAGENCCQKLRGAGGWGLGLWRGGSHGSWQGRAWQPLLSHCPSQGQDIWDAMVAAPALGIRHLPGDGDRDAIEQGMRPQVEIRPDSTANPSPPARQWGEGSDSNQVLGLQLKAGIMAGEACPLPPIVLLRAFSLTHWDGDTLGGADRELIPQTHNQTLLGGMLLWPQQFLESYFKQRKA